MGKIMSINNTDIVYCDTCGRINYKHCLFCNEYTCCHCGTVMEEDTAYVVEDDEYCESCFNESYFYCNDCGNAERNEDCFVACDGDLLVFDLCEDCFNKDYFYCSNCGECFRSDKRYETSDAGGLCGDCFNKDYFICTICEETYPISELTNDETCKDCSKKELNEEMKY